MASNVSDVVRPIQSPGAKDCCLKVEFTAATLYRLLTEGRLRASDFRCLDADSHRCIRKLLVQSCLESIRRAYCYKAPGANHDIDWQEGE